jgi:hypothetical protein
MMLVQFTLTIEIPDEMSEDNHEEVVETENKFSATLTNMEEVIGKSEYTLDNSSWEYL